MVLGLIPYSDVLPFMIFKYLNFCSSYNSEAVFLFEYLHNDQGFVHFLSNIGYFKGVKSS